jgi:hypothetical protein
MRWLAIGLLVGPLTTGLAQGQTTAIAPPDYAVTRPNLFFPGPSKAPSLRQGLPRQTRPVVARNTTQASSVPKPAVPPPVTAALPMVDHSVPVYEEFSRAGLLPVGDAAPTPAPSRRQPLGW